MPSQPTKGPKLRQTCDPCRKAKVKCDKRMPICGRCIASGAPCDYGISNQGGRWRNGEKLGGNRHAAKSSSDSDASKSTPVDPGPTLVSESPVSDDSFPDSASVTLAQPLTLGDPVIFRHSLHGDSIWNYDLAMCQQPSFPSYAGTTPLPPMSPGFPSPLSTASSFWFPATGPPPSESDTSQEYLHQTGMAPESCTCFAATLAVLQSLHQRCPHTTSSQPLDPSALSYAAVLDINEQASSCCANMLRCPSCRADDTGHAFILLTTLIRKTLLMIEAWVALPPTRIKQATDESGPLSGTSSSSLSGSFAALPSAGGEDDRRLKAEVSLIGIKKLEDVVVELKQASQGIRVDYDRLACSSLAASLGARLRSASDMLSAELEGKGGSSGSLSAI